MEMLLCPIRHGYIYILDNDQFLMGNQIAHTPDQILNVETCFNDLSEYTYVKK